MQENLTVTPGGVSSFEVDGGRLLVPGFGRLGERLFHAAVAGGTDDPTITGFLDSVLDFAAGNGPRLEKLRLRRQATGVYPTTEGEIVETRIPSQDRVSREEGLRLVLWACDELEGQRSHLRNPPRTGGRNVAGATFYARACGYTHAAWSRTALYRGWTSGCGSPL